MEEDERQQRSNAESKDAGVEPRPGGRQRDHATRLVLGAVPAGSRCDPGLGT